MSRRLAMLLHLFFMQRRIFLLSLLLTVFAVFVLCLLQTWDPSTVPVSRNLWRLDAPSDRKPVNVTASIKPLADRNYTILIWRHGQQLSRRFFRSFGSRPRDVFQFCSVRNCRVSIDDATLESSDAVVFHLHRTKGPHTLPATRRPHQLWIFFTDESPFHTFLETRKYSMKDYDGIFNLSMTYRSDADVPVPYGRTVRLTPTERATAGPPQNYAVAKRRLVAVMGSNCGGKNFRWDYVRELSKHLAVDVYGGCGKLKCPGHFAADCPALADYKFYLAFENCNCREYITEKMWWNAYGKESVPVVMGAFKEDYRKLCPPKSFIHVDDFDGPPQLALHLLYLDRNDSAYNQYFAWKTEYRVVNEHGYFGSPSLHMCRICEALNRLDGRLAPPYANLETYWNSKTDCREPGWRPPPKRKNANA